jgi:hypothetical protein
MSRFGPRFGLLENVWVARDDIYLRRLCLMVPRMRKLRRRKHMVNRILELVRLRANFRQGLHDGHQRRARDRELMESILNDLKTTP